ncbi:MAG: hypothetical protein P1V97_28610 [Planctomycetota bacterium]|nr:hypothetical protein [Planctomycetota bacterium]
MTQKFTGTTYEIVVERSKSYPELLERLYDFGLEEKLTLPVGVSQSSLHDALAELIARLMEATDVVLTKNPGRNEFDCALEVLKGETFGPLHK